MIRSTSLHAASPDLEALLSGLVARARELLPFDSGGIVITNQDAGTLDFHIYQAATPGFQVCASIQPGEGLIGTVAVTARPALVDEISFQSGCDPSTRAAIAAPMLLDKWLLGVFVAESTRPAAYAPHHLKILETLADQAALMVNMARLFAVERARADLMALVNQISRGLTATLSLPELTHKVVRAIHEQLGYDAVSLMLLDEGAQRMTIRAALASTPWLTRETGYAFGLDATAEDSIGRAVRTGETQLIGAIPRPEGAIAGAHNNLPVDGLREPVSTLLVPLRFGTRALGVIEVIVPRAHALDRADALALETLAAQVSVAIENARLWEQARRRLLEQSIVHQIGQDLTAILDYSDLVSAVVRHLTRALDSGMCLLVGHDPESGQISIEAEYRQHELTNASLPSFIGNRLGRDDRAMITQVIRSRRLMIRSRGDGVPRAPYHRHLEEIGVYTQLTLPMIASDRVIGCVMWLETRSERVFSVEDLRLAQTLTTQAAIAIENARLYRQAQRQVREQALLRRVAVGLGMMGDMKSLLNQFAAEIFHAIGGVAAVNIAVRDDHQWHYAGTQRTTRVALDTSLLAYLRANPPTQATILAILEQGKPLQASANTPDSTGVLSGFFAEHPISVLLTPIMRRHHELIGVVEALIDRPGYIFETSAVQFVEALAHQGATALETVSFHQREQRRLQRLEKLQASNRAIAGQLRTALLLDTIVGEAAQIFGAEAVSLMTRETGSPFYRIRAAVGLSDTYVRERRAPVQEFDDLRVIMHGTRGTRSSDVRQNELIREEGLNKVLVIPLIKAGQQLGLLNLYAREEPRFFSDEERELAVLFAGQAAIALENAMLFEALEERAAELTTANRLKSEFLARVSHELRTPMNSIIGYSEMLLRPAYGALTELQADRIARILRNGRNLLMLIDDLLDISRIDAGKMALSSEPVDLCEEVRATLENLESQATARDLFLKLEAEAELPMVRADPARVRQIITNLVSNAVKFTREGGVQVQIRAVNGPEGRPEVWTTVIDTGIGIHPDDQRIIFDEFRQADGSSTREFGGTGLGLAITRKLVEMMGGRIWLESTPGQGSAFTFSLPVDAAAT